MVVREGRTVVVVVDQGYRHAGKGTPGVCTDERAGVAPALLDQPSLERAVLRCTLRLVATETDHSRKPPMASRLPTQPGEVQP